MTNRLYAADLFCGAGGTSTGLLKAAQELGLNVQLIAVNHWDVAISTHSLNHPNVKHFQSDLEKIDPKEVVPGGKLALLVASPECTHFSKARGGKPMSKQSRASVKYILRWIAALDIENVLIENVPEFLDWGPLHRKGENINKPIKNRKGEYFHRFVRKMREQGYIVKWRVLNAADYGDPTTRKRLFVMASKGRVPMFPEPTHAKVSTDMFGTRPAWRPARDIIDWSIKGESVFTRKRPLADNTMRRIMAGLKKFGGKAFVVTTNWTETNRTQPRSVDEPVNAITGQGQIGLAEPFLIEYHSGKGSERRTRPVDQPMPTLDTSNRFGLVQSFIMPVNHGKDTRTHSLDDPMPTVTSVDAWSLIEPFIIQMDQGGKLQDINLPMSTLTSADSRALVEPFILPFFGERDNQKTRTHSINDPLPTITSHGAGALVEPFLVEYYGTGSTSSVDEPLKTQTGRDRFGLVQPMVFDHDGKRYLLDIRFRMLQPHELARAMSFPKGYKFHGNREQVVKQIGNAVPVELASALCGAHLSRYRKAEPS
jgi:DNA (cytosine-5)-methyltransferase 1